MRLGGGASFVEPASSVSRDSHAGLTEPLSRVNHLPGPGRESLSGTATAVSRSHTPVDACVRLETRLPVWMPPRAVCHPGCALLDLAAGLARLGYSPIPLGQGKVPRVKWGMFQLDSPAWRDLYNEWWPATWRAARGVGVVTGRPHRLVVDCLSRNFPCTLENCGFGQKAFTTQPGRNHCQ